MQEMRAVIPVSSLFAGVAPTAAEGDADEVDMAVGVRDVQLHAAVKPNSVGNESQESCPAAKCTNPTKIRRRSKYAQIESVVVACYATACGTQWWGVGHQCGGWGGSTGNGEDETSDW